MKYQIRIRENMSDAPASGLIDTYQEAVKKLQEVQQEIRATWATPDPNAAYIQTYHSERR